MAGGIRKITDNITAFARQRRRVLAGIAGAIVVYALLGFFFAPWLVRTKAIEIVEDALGAELRIGNVAINPFVLSLRVDQLELDDPDGEPFLAVGQVFVNFQASSLFRWALTFDEVRIDAPHAYLERDAGGRLNTAFLAPGESDETEASDVPGDASMPRLIVFAFAVNDSLVDWRDEFQPEPVVTQFGPVSVDVRDLSTLPSREGVQEVLIATETNGTLSWRGSLQLNPFKSVGTAAVTGSHFPLISRYVRHDIGLDIERGDADLSLQYAVDTRADGTVTASVDDLRIVLTDILVRRFDAEQAAGGEAGREVLTLPRLEIAGGRFRWPEQSVSVASLALDDAVVSLRRGAAGRMDIVPARGESHVSGEEAPPTAGSAPWSITLDRFAIRRASVGLIDDSVSPAADIGLEQIDLSIEAISNSDGAVFPTSLTARARSGGTISAAGHVTVLPEPAADFEFTVDGLLLSLVQPYLNAEADISVDSGALGLTGTFHHGADNVFVLNTDIAVTDFLVTETDEGSRLGSWTRLDVAGVSLDLDAESLGIGAIRLTEPYADIFIAADGTVNLGRIEKGRQVAGDEVDAEVPPEVTTEEPASAFNVSIGEVLVSKGSARFADASLPLPFEADIADLNGNVTTIATASAEPAAVSLEGKVDEYGLVRVSGTLTPLDPPKNTDIKVVFQNVDMPKFSAYTIPFAGREIASGRLDLDLGYQMTDGALVGANKVVLRDFELGDKVPHPGAMSLPLGLAVALLKDPSGKIDIDLPVRGNVNDPEFGYGKVIGKALVNLIVKIVASPFALLGNLIGVEANELEFIAFEPGRADLTPPEQERAAKLAEALSLRPELVLEIPPVFVTGLDGAALRAAQLDALLDTRLAESRGETTAQERTQALEQLYRETAAVENPDAALASLRQQFTTVLAEDGGDTGEPSFDALAYTAGLRRQLIDLQTLAPDVLAGLAETRAANTRDAIVAIDPSLDSRIVTMDIDDQPDVENDAVRMRVSLAVGE